MSDHNWLVVSVSGITGGGKSDLCTTLFRRLPLSARLIRQDDYFLPEDSPKHVAVECSDGISHCNWDIVTSLDMDKMKKDILDVIENPPKAMDKSQISYVNMEVNENREPVKCGSWPIKSEKNNKHSNEEKTTTACNIVPQEMFSPNSTDIINSLNTEDVPSCEMRPVLILDGFTVLDHPGILQLTEKTYFFTLTKEECFKRRELRHFDPPDIPGYFDNCVWPMFEEYSARCRRDYGTKVPVVYVDGTRNQRETHQIVLDEVMKMARE